MSEQQINDFDEQMELNQLAEDIVVDKNQTELPLEDYLVKSVENTPKKKALLERAKNNVQNHKKAYISTGVLTVSAAAGALYVMKNPELQRKAYRVIHQVSKNSPLIFTGIGAAGLLGSAYLAYKAAPQVEAIVDDIAVRRSAGENISSAKAAIMIAKPLSPTVALAGLSITAIGASWYISNGRINDLSTLVRQQADALSTEKDESVVKEIEMTDQEGKKKSIPVRVNRTNDLTGRWLEESNDFVSDDKEYMLTHINYVEKELSNIIFAKGSVTLNQALDALGFDRIPEGASLGWTDSRSLEFNVAYHTDDEGKEFMYLKWTPLTSVYDTVGYYEN